MESHVDDVANNDGDDNTKYGAPEAKGDSFNGEAGEDFAG